MSAHFAHGILGMRPPQSECPLEFHCVAQVVPALGAEEIVAFCGGVHALLAALGVDLRDAFLPEACLNMPGQVYAVIPFMFRSLVVVQSDAKMAAIQPEDAFGSL